MHRLALLPFLLFLSSAATAQVHQDTILLLNGNVVATRVIDTTNGVTSFPNPRKPGKNFIIENDRIFSITDSTGEHVLYVYDTLIGNEFTVEEMRYFIRGEQDAEKGFNATGALVANIAIGVASGLTGHFLCPVPPFAFAALSGATKVKIRHSTVSNPDYLKHPPYLMGYERVARKKRKISSLIGGGIGLGVGLGAFFIYSATTK